MRTKQTKSFSNRGVAKYALPLLIFLALSTIGQSQDRFPDTPENHWVFQTLLNFKNSLVPDIAPENFRGTQTRRNLALIAIQVNDRLLQIASRIHVEDPFYNTRAEQQRLRDEVIKLEGHADNISNLLKVIDLFAPELTSLGRDVEKMKVGLWVLRAKNGELRMRFADAESLYLDPFPDVPKEHWVYEALYNGRNNELFFGYPDGQFRGGRPLTRYEMAGAVNAFYQDVRRQVMMLMDQIDYINRAPVQGPNNGSRGG